jgi:hypothetical protein
MRIHDLGPTRLIQFKATDFVPTADFKAISVKKLSPVLPVPSRKNLQVPFASCADMLKHDGDKNTPLWQLAVEYERARGNFTERKSSTR